MKARYLSKGSADAGITFLRRFYPEIEEYSYPCRACKCYHTATYLTKQEEMKLRLAM